MPCIPLIIPCIPFIMDIVSATVPRWAGVRISRASIAVRAIGLTMGAPMEIERFAAPGTHYG